MNIGIFSCYLCELYQNGQYKSLDASFAYAKSRGITSCEVFTSEFAALPFEDYRDALSRAGIDFRTLISFLPYSAQDENICKKTTEQYKKYIDMLSASDAKYFMLVPNVKQVYCEDDKKRVRDYIVKSAASLSEYMKGSGITLIMENFSLHSHPYSTINEMKYLAENVPGLKLALDAGNFYCVGEDVLNAYDVLREYIVDVHFKDWQENPFGCIVRPNLPALEGGALGQGVLPLSELISKLKADAYNGHIVIELNASKTDFDGYYDSVEFLRRELNA